MDLSIYEEMDSVITLNGIVKELGLEGYFEVPIDIEESVFALKEAIYDKIKDFLPNNITGGISIKLWKVNDVSCNDLKVDQLKHPNATVENLLGGDEIYSHFLVKEHFNKLNSSEIHIIVQDVPNHCILCGKGFENDDNDLICHLLDPSYEKKVKYSFADFIKKSREEAKRNYDETVVVKKPTHYRTDYQIDVEENDNQYSNPGDRPDSDD